MNFSHDDLKFAAKAAMVVEEMTGGRHYGYYFYLMHISAGVPYKRIGYMYDMPGTYALGLWLFLKPYLKGMPRSTFYRLLYNGG